MNGPDTADTNRVSGNWRTSAPTPILLSPTWGGEWLIANPVIVTGCVIVPILARRRSSDFGELFLSLATRPLARVSFGVQAYPGRYYIKDGEGPGAETPLLHLSVSVA